MRFAYFLWELSSQKRKHAAEIFLTTWAMTVAVSFNTATAYAQSGWHSQAHHNSYPKSEWPKHFGDCDVLYSAVDHKLYSIHMFMHNVGRAINLPAIYTYSWFCPCVCAYVHTYVPMWRKQKSHAHAPRCTLTCHPWTSIPSGWTRVYQIEMMLALSSESTRRCSFFPAITGSDK